MISPTGEALGVIKLGNEVDTIVVRQSCDGQLELASDSLCATLKMLEDNENLYSDKVRDTLLDEQERLWGKLTKYKNKSKKGSVWATFYVNPMLNFKYRKYLKETLKHEDNVKHVTATAKLTRFNEALGRKPSDAESDMASFSIPPPQNGATATPSPSQSSNASPPLGNPSQSNTTTPPFTQPRGGLSNCINVIYGSNNTVMAPIINSSQETSVQSDVLNQLGELMKQMPLAGANGAEATAVPASTEAAPGSSSSTLASASPSPEESSGAERRLDLIESLGQLLNDVRMFSENNPDQSADDNVWAS